jgi:hypothetical protein
VDINDAASPRREVLAHFLACENRHAAMTEKQIEALATHIAGLVGDHFEFVLRMRRRLSAS